MAPPEARARKRRRSDDARCERPAEGGESPAARSREQRGTKPPKCARTAATDVATSLPKTRRPAGGACLEVATDRAPPRPQRASAPSNSWHSASSASSRSDSLHSFSSLRQPSASSRLPRSSATPHPFSHPVSSFSVSSSKPVRRNAARARFVSRRALRLRLLAGALLYRRLTRCERLSACSRPRRQPEANAPSPLFANVLHASAAWAAGAWTRDEFSNQGLQKVARRRLDAECSGGRTESARKGKLGSRRVTQRALVKDAGREREGRTRDTRSDMSNGDKKVKRDAPRPAGGETGPRESSAPLNPTAATRSALVRAQWRRVQRLAEKQLPTGERREATGGSEEVGGNEDVEPEASDAGEGAGEEGTDTGGEGGAEDSEDGEDDADEGVRAEGEEEDEAAREDADELEKGDEEDEKDEGDAARVVERGESDLWTEGVIPLHCRAPTAAAYRARLADLEALLSRQGVAHATLALSCLVSEVGSVWRAQGGDPGAESLANGRQAEEAKKTRREAKQRGNVQGVWHAASVAPANPQEDEKGGLDARFSRYRAEMRRFWVAKEQDVFRFLRQCCTVQGLHRAAPAASSPRASRRRRGEASRASDDDDDDEDASEIVAEQGDKKNARAVPSLDSHRTTGALKQATPVSAKLTDGRQCAFYQALLRTNLHVAAQAADVSEAAVCAALLLRQVQRAAPLGPREVRETASSVVAAPGGRAARRRPEGDGAAAREADWRGGAEEGRKRFVLLQAACSRLSIVCVRAATQPLVGAAAHAPSASQFGSLSSIGTNATILECLRAVQVLCEQLAGVDAEEESRRSRTPRGGLAAPDRGAGGEEVSLGAALDAWEACGGNALTHSATAARPREARLRFVAVVRLVKDVCRELRLGNVARVLKVVARLKRLVKSVVVRGCAAQRRGGSETPACGSYDSDQRRAESAGDAADRARGSRTSPPSGASWTAVPAEVCRGPSIELLLTVLCLLEVFVNDLRAAGAEVFFRAASRHSGLEKKGSRLQDMLRSLPVGPAGAGMAVDRAKVPSGPRKKAATSSSSSTDASSTSLCAAVCSPLAEAREFTPTLPLSIQRILQTGSWLSESTADLQAAAQMSSVEPLAAVPGGAARANRTEPKRVPSSLSQLLPLDAIVTSQTSLRKTKSAGVS
ncbi:hypothetical protein BESB_020830 [Besnoitia besnoiti]|uniref:Uncharacterized protein n=1 Tax=Besnoitia besnoiti TaxID=94643 RepID=A0A2A9M9T9_BESBE|nr:hypothetical protein BESB_020830 [Besnoitia besnoiti]PFH32142.1 hypothetical protein BESB_020830 [Besnoitia besnoiti]